MKVYERRIFDTNIKFFYEREAYNFLRTRLSESTICPKTHMEVTPCMNNNLIT